jgi:hypothetical protein
MSTQKSIIFSCNWNGKLFCKCHSTMRIRNDKKYILSDEYIEILKDIPFQVVKIVAMVHFPLVKCTESMALLDTGYCRAEHIKMLETMYKNKPFNVYDIEWSYIILQHVAPIQQPND